MSRYKISVDNREEALKAIRDGGLGFLFLAALQGVLGFLVMPAVLLDAILYAVLALALIFLKSRIVAIFLLLLSLLTLATTALNRLGMMSSGGNNIFLALVMVYIGVRVVLATFALHRPQPDPQDYAEKYAAAYYESAMPPQPAQSDANTTSPLERILLIVAAFLIGVIALIAALILRT